MNFKPKLHVLFHFCLIVALLSIDEQKHLASNIFVTWRPEQGETREREVVGPPVGNFGKGRKKGLPFLDFWYCAHNTKNLGTTKTDPEKAKESASTKLRSQFSFGQLNFTKTLSFIG
jgi:hypothetical protein